MPPLKMTSTSTFSLEIYNKKKLSVFPSLIEETSLFFTE